MGLMFSRISQANLSSFIVPSATARMAATQVASSVLKSNPFGFRDNQSCPLVTVNERVVFSDPMAAGGGQRITSAI
jgi:hypothetical protein